MLTNNSRIEFDIPSTSDPNCNVGTGVCTISPTSGIGSISESNVAIDGYTQLGAQPNTMSTGNDADLKVQFDIANYGGLSSFLDVTGAGFELTGIAVDGVVNTSILALETGADNSWVHGNFLGMDVSGSATTSSGGIPGVYVIGANNVTIGGPNVADRNVIAGNQEEISLLQGDATTIQNNYIGTNAAGTAALAADSSSGISINAGATNVTIGGGSSSARNVISGNLVGINSQADGVRIQGNYIGTNATGTAAVPNDRGVSLSGVENLVGGSGAGEGNVISGSDSSAIDIDGTNTRVSGNYIGTNASGTAAIPNRFGVQDDGDNTLIGGGQPSARNVISGNTETGVELFSQSGGSAVRRNYIGTNAAGTGAIPNGTGILVGSPNADIYFNLVSGNTVAGVAITQEGDGAHVRTNFIGSDKNGNSNLGNSGTGVVAYLGATDVVVGGITGPDANLIVDNFAGVVIGPPQPSRPARLPASLPQGEPLPGPASVAVFRNSITANDTLGIDIIPDLGHNANDAGDSDTGSNGLQNAPVLTSAVAGSTVVSGTFDSTPNRDFRFEMFSSNNCDSSTYGEGRIYSGFGILHTDVDGAIEFSALSLNTAQPGDIITATVTDLTTNETSEFSNCVTVTGAPSPSPTAPGETPTPTPIGIDTPEPSAVITDEPTPVATPTPTASPTPTPGASGTTTPLPSDNGSATPTVTATPTGTAGPSGTPSPTPFVCPSPETSTCTPPPEERVWGDDNCSGEADPVDSLLTLRHDAGLPTDTGDCPEMGELITHGIFEDPWGDIDCSGEVNPVDSLKLLRFDAGLTVPQDPSCPDIGALTQIS